MARRPKEMIWPHLNDCGGDMKQFWYVEYSFRNSVTGKMERFRHYDGFKNFDTDRERRVYAKKIIDKYTAEIKAGKISLETEIEYEDQLGFGGKSTFARKKKTFAGSARLYISDFIKYKTTEINEKSLIN
jgi:hypothetical protein